jgi:hypothetical protein
MKNSLKSLQDMQAEYDKTYWENEEKRSFALLETQKKSSTELADMQKQAMTELLEMQKTGMKDVLELQKSYFSDAMKFVVKNTRETMNDINSVNRLTK